MDSDYSALETDTAECRYGVLRFPRHDSIIGKALRQYGEWAQAEVELLLRFVQPGADVVDAGAFIGTHTAAFAKTGLAGTKVHAFEPQPDYFALLRENAQANHWTNVETHAQALSDAAGELVVAAERTEGPINHGGTRLTDAGNQISSHLTLAAMPLDALELSSCALIKLDVEGMELRVLRGSNEMIRRCQPVVYAECNSAEGGWGVIVHMRDLGYQCLLFSFSAFNPSNFRQRTENLFGAAREVGLLFLPSAWPTPELERLTTDVPLARIETFDDLVLGLIRKPQYKYEVLATCAAESVLGNDFWLNEPETLGLRSTLDDARSRAEQLAGLLAQVEGVAAQAARAAVQLDLEQVQACIRSEVSQVSALLARSEQRLEVERQAIAERAARAELTAAQIRAEISALKASIAQSQLSAESARAEQLAGLLAQVEGGATQAARAAVQLDLEQVQACIRSEVSQLSALLARSEQRLEAEKQAIAERAALAELTAAQTRAEISALKASRSWRVSAPLRVMSDSLRTAATVLSPRGPVAKGVRAAYWKLPLGVTSRRRIKDWVFGTFPGPFSDTVTFRQWRAFRAEADVLARARAVPQTASPREAGIAAQVASLPLGASLPEADGRWEWAAYDEVRDRTVRAENARKRAALVSRASMLEFGTDELEHRIRRLNFNQQAAPLVSILIPTYNNLKYTVECLTSIMLARSDVSFEILIADDASSDGSAATLKNVPNLRVLEAHRNVGFLLNVNRALPELRGQYVVLLNNDVQVQGNWLDALTEAFRSAPGIGAVGPRIVYPSGHLQEAGCSLRPDGTSAMIGLGDDPAAPQYAYRRDVDYCSGACLLLETATLRELGGFDESFAPAYFEDADLCLRLRQRGLRVVYEPNATIVHHLSKTTATEGTSSKLALVGRSLARFGEKWQAEIGELTDVRLIAFYLPQFHPIPENDHWWGTGFTEWRNVASARPNFGGHYQPRIPGELGFYDLRIAEVLERQAALARRYGLEGFCFYYYWFAGKRLLEMPLERLLETGRPDIPFCLCWANENWTRRWDGQEQEILMAQQHSDADDAAVIRDLMRYMRSPNYIRINGRPFLLVYRVTLFPDFARTAATWRRICREEGLGEIYLAMVESFEMVFASTDPARYGCDAAVEFPPQGMAEPLSPSGTVLNPAFEGNVADYRDLAVRYCLRDGVPYVRFRGVMPGWDNTARRQDNSFCFEHATPGAFQAWAEHIIYETRVLRSGDERIVFVNAWNEWAEGAYLEPDRRFGHGFLEALSNARESALLKRVSRYPLG